MKILLPILILSVSSALSFSQTSLSGKVTDADTGEEIIFGTVAIFKNDVLLTGTETDLDGFYSITGLEAGVYEVVFSYTGYTDQKVTKVEVPEGKNTRLDAKLSSKINGRHRPTAIIQCFPYPNLYRADNLTQGFTFKSRQIRCLAIDH